MLFLSPVSARISVARGPRVTLVLGALVIAFGYAIRIADSRDLWVIVLGGTIVSVGTALACSALPTLILGAVPAGQTGSASGVDVLMRTIGRAVCSAAVAAILVHHTHPVGGSPLSDLRGCLPAFARAGTVALAGCAMTLPIPVGGGPVSGGPAKAGRLSRRRGRAADTLLEGAGES